MYEQNSNYEGSPKGFLELEKKKTEIWNSMCCLGKSGWNGHSMFCWKVQYLS